MLIVADGSFKFSQFVISVAKITASLCFFRAVPSFFGFLEAASIEVDIWHLRVKLRIDTFLSELIT